MLTWASRSRCKFVCGALSAFAVLACSVDERMLALTHEDDDSAASAGSAARGGSPASGGSNSIGEPDHEGGSANGSANGDQPELRAGAESDSDEPSPSCIGEARARRCAIAGGSFQLGPAQAPVPSELSSFQLDELEVTVGRFRQYVISFSGPPAAGAGAHPEIEHSGWRSEWDAFLPSNQQELSSSLHCNADWETWSDAPDAREDYPLTCASYYVAFAFCAWSGGRLPTEAEWEYAASGGAEQRLYPWGNADPSFELALFNSSAITPAGDHRPGMARFGQLDLAGSAWEWTLDRYRPYPSRCDHCAELERGLDRVLRGGAFLYQAEYLKAAYRFHTDPQLALGDVGFRCAYAADAR